MDMTCQVQGLWLSGLRPVTSGTGTLLNRLGRQSIPSMTKRSSFFSSVRSLSMSYTPCCISGWYEISHEKGHSNMLRRTKLRQQKYGGGGVGCRTSQKNLIADTQSTTEDENENGVSLGMNSSDIKGGEKGRTKLKDNRDVVPVTLGKAFEKVPTTFNLQANVNTLMFINGVVLVEKALWELWVGSKFLRYSILTTAYMSVWFLCCNQ